MSRVSSSAQDVGHRLENTLADIPAICSLARFSASQPSRATPHTASLKEQIECSTPHGCLSIPAILFPFRVRARCPRNDHIHDPYVIAIISPLSCYKCCYWNNQGRPSFVLYFIGLLRSRYCEAKNRHQQWEPNFPQPASGNVNRQVRWCSFL